MSQTRFSAMCALSLVLAAFHASTASAKVWARVCLADEVTPLALADPNVAEVYRDIMVGTRLAIFIKSDTAESWGGQLWLSNQSLSNGEMSGRDYNPLPPLPNYDGSCLPEAGRDARVSKTLAMEGVFFTLGTAWDVAAGDWFVFDYRAVSVGACSIGLYSNILPGTPEDPRDPYIIGAPPPWPVSLLQVLYFNHVPSRDYSGDGIVNFADFALLADGWKEAGLQDPNVAPGLDMNGDARVDVRDLAVFSEYWLGRTNAVRPAPDPNEMDSMP